MQFCRIKITQMKNFRIVPLAIDYVKRIKETLIDDFGHDVKTQLATGRGPCRVSLKPFEVGKDERLLLSHSPFEIDNAFNQPGPVFINKKDVKAYEDIYNFPPEIKSNKDSFPLSLIGYSKDQQMNLTQLVGERDVDDLIVEIFNEHSEVEYLHARNAKACCYICKIERI